MTGKAVVNGVDSSPEYTFSKPTRPGIRLWEGLGVEMGEHAVVEVTELRNPCDQLNGIQHGLMAALVHRDDAGRVIRKAGVMGIVLAAGEVRAGDPIEVTVPPEPHRPLDRV